MTRALLTSAAALAALIVSGQAQALGKDAVSTVAVHSSPGSGHMRGDGRHFGSFACDSRDGRGHGRHDRGGSSNCTVYADNWGYYDPDFNRSWDSDSYNDWWHDRPDRAYPRWVQHNENCEPDRMWWSGSGWHC
jgi:hypothetical protein